MSKFSDEVTALVTKYKEVFKKHNIKLTEDAPREYMAEAKLEDGTIIKTTAAEWVQGSDAYMIGEGGEETPLQAGSYILETGEELVIGEDGLVAELKAKAEEEVEMSTEDALTVIKSLSDRVTELEGKFAQAESTIEAKATEVTAVKAQLSAKTKELEALKKKPAAESVTEHFTKKKEKATEDEPKKGSAEWFMQFTNEKSN